MLNSTELINNYRNALSKLINNNKTDIDILTIKAKGLKSYASQIVDLICSDIMSASSKRKLLLMYLIDSILKNVGKDYIGHFNHRIVALVSNTFQTGDEQVRKSLSEMRAAWGIGKVFHPAKLLQLDAALNGIAAENMEKENHLPPMGSTMKRKLEEDPSTTKNPKRANDDVFREWKCWESGSNSKHPACSYVNQNSHSVQRSQPVIVLQNMVEAKSPQTSRIFIDGISHDVNFMNECAYIQRGDKAFKVYFTGGSRCITIDHNLHSIKFGEKKRILIDGVAHVIHFGGPGRELYVNSNHINAQFGGSSVYINLNGVQHTIKLIGTTPGVWVDPKPDYFITANLARTLTINTEKRRRAVAPSLRGFEEHVLRVKYENVIESLLKKPKDTCHLCYYKFEKTSSKNQKADHMDSHVQKNLGLQVTRSWYFTPEAWPQLETEQQKPSVENEENTPTVTGVVSGDQKSCDVCWEDFEEFYDDDDESWRFKNTILLNDKVVHVTCVPENSTIESHR